MDVQWRVLPGRHRFELLRHGRVVADLEWHQDPRRRAEVGWYLRPAGASETQRLPRDADVERLAADGDAPDAVWTDDADATALISAAVARRVARDALRRRDPEAMAAADDDVSLGRLEIEVLASDPDDVVSGFPGLDVRCEAQRCFLTGEFTAGSLRWTLICLNLLRAEVVACVGVRD